MCRKNPPVRIDLPSAQRTLRNLRWAGWLVLAVEVALLAGCWHFVGTRQRLWWPYLGTLAAVLLWYHVLPLGFGRWLTKVAARVHPTGDHWRIGRYSEAELRQVIEVATAGLPPPMRRLNVCIVDARCVAAWTWLSVFRPHGKRASTIVLTSGSLHYLERDELAAVLLHEVAHHLPQHRMGVFGGWPLADAALHAAAFWAYGVTSSVELGVLVFLIPRWLGLISAAAVAGNLSQTIEHLCDLFAAQRMGSLAMTTALLKMGEDEELSEVVMVWVAREMLDDNTIGLDDLTLALAEARPYGRIFHENLFRHASEVCRILRGDRRSPDKPRKPGRENVELKEFVEKRRSRQVRRIRWRRFDDDSDGILTAAEVARLCEALLAHPQNVLFTSQNEIEPTTHPRCRDRILLLQ